jgi:hypothetical protein
MVFMSMFGFTAPSRLSSFALEKPNGNSKWTGCEGKNETQQSYSAALLNPGSPKNTPKRDAAGHADSNDCDVEDSHKNFWRIGLTQSTVSALPGGASSRNPWRAIRNPSHCCISGPETCTTLDCPSNFPASFGICSLSSQSPVLNRSVLGLMGGLEQKIERRHG